jgi:hypothetical protein
MTRIGVAGGGAVPLGAGVESATDSESGASVLW